jgi:hypothetical protein
MHKGVPLAILAPAGLDDYESVQMSTNPEFMALLERSRKSSQEEGGIPAAEVRKMFADDKDASCTTPRLCMSGVVPGVVLH